jgi:hypothetical protein
VVGQEIAGKGDVTVGTQDSDRLLNEDMAVLWPRIGELIVRGQKYVGARLDGLETDVAALKTDVAVLKIDVAESKDQLGRLERSTETRFNRVDAQLERLITLVQRSETKPS